MDPNVLHPLQKMLFIFLFVNFEEISESLLVLEYLRWAYVIC